MLPVLHLDQFLLLVQIVAYDDPDDFPEVHQFLLQCCNYLGHLLRIFVPAFPFCFASLLHILCFGHASGVMCILVQGSSVEQGRQFDPYCATEATVITTASLTEVDDTELMRAGMFLTLCWLVPDVRWVL